MSKLYKQMTIDGENDLIERYSQEKLDFGKIFHADSCPFCILYQEHYCNGCFMEGEEFDCMDTYSLGKHNNSNVIKAKLVKERAKWHISILPYLEKIPAIYFTPSGWQNFDNFMPEGWRNRILGENEEMTI